MTDKEKLLKSLSTKFSPRIVNAFRHVKREDFIEEKWQKYAYVDGALPISKEATISQPYTIAFMLELLELEENQKILEIGSGCGYLLALINFLVPNSIIYGLEIDQQLVAMAEKLVDQKNVFIINGNGFLGLKEESPFDRIIASAAFFQEPLHLLEQLKDNGILVSPVGNYIYKYKKQNQAIQKEVHYGFSFVKMIDGNLNASI